MNFPASLRMPSFGASSRPGGLSTRLPQIVAAVLVIAIAWQGVQLIWLLRHRAPAPAAVNTATSVTVPQEMSRNDVQSIVSAHLFGVANIENADPNNAPPTQVALVLAGVMATEDPKRGYAIVGESAANAKVHLVGSPLPGGVRLYAVYPDRVLIDRNGQIETLALPRQPGGLAPPRVASTPASNGNFAENVRRLAQSNPNAFGEVLRPQPVFANGTQRGYRVYPGRDRKQFAQLGLQPGDLVTSINGTPLDDPARGQEVLNTMATSDRVNVTVERNGQTQQLTLNMAQVTLPPSDAPAAPPSGANPETE
jgi:general secretion pathway protein C